MMDKMKKWKILIVDDEAHQREIIKVILANEDYEVESAENGRKAIEIAAVFSPDVILCDLKLPDMEGMQVMDALKTSGPHTHAFIIFTAYGTIESAVDAIKQGAFDYITKPVERQKLILITQRACERLALIRENRQLKKQLARPFSVEGIIAKHPKMLKVLDFVRMVGPLNVTVLIMGETGTGKDLAARAIHGCSHRKQKTFQAVNCASMPETLLESELFGYEKGAFTGAYSQKQGLIESSDGGSIFLDEIGEMPLGPQAKLLRFMEEKKIRRIGGKQELPMDVRIIAATNKRLTEEIKKGNFREDLFYRFRGFILDLPPLRERMSDIHLLAKSFMEKYNLVFEKKLQGIGSDAMRLLMEYAWPGNVRQLDSVIEKAVLLSRGDYLEPEDIDIPRGQGHEDAADTPFDFSLNGGISLDEMERQMIIKAMERANGCITQAAKLLGTTYRTVEYRLKKYGLSRPYPPIGESSPPKR